MTAATTPTALYTHNGPVSGYSTALIDKGRVVVTPWPAGIHPTTPFAVRAPGPAGGPAVAWLRPLTVRVFVFDDHGRLPTPPSIGVITVAAGVPYAPGPALTPIPPPEFEDTFVDFEDPARALAQLAPDIFTVRQVDGSVAPAQTTVDPNKLAIPQYTVTSGDRSAVVEGFCRWLGWD